MTLKKLKKGTKQFVGAGVTLGLGSLTISKLGSGVDTSYLGTMGSMIRPMGTAFMGTQMIGMVTGINLKKKRKKRRR